MIITKFTFFGTFLNHFEKNGFVLHLESNCDVVRKEISPAYLQTQQAGKRNQSMKIPEQSLLGS